MHKCISCDRENYVFPKVTKMGSIFDHRIDYNGIGVLKGQRHKPSYSSNPPGRLPPFITSLFYWLWVRIGINCNCFKRRAYYIYSMHSAVLKKYIMFLLLSMLRCLMYLLACSHYRYLKLVWFSDFETRVI